MPKEVIYDRLMPFGEDSPAVAVAEVHWSRESSHVQLVTRCIDRSTHEVYQPDEEVPRGPGEGLSYRDGFWTNLDRRSINDLIRHLRRARDQAFGRDE